MKIPIISTVALIVACMTEASDVVWYNLPNAHSDTTAMAGSTIRPIMCFSNEVDSKFLRKGVFTLQLKEFKALNLTTDVLNEIKARQLRKLALEYEFEGVSEQAIQQALEIKHQGRIAKYISLAGEKLKSWSGSKKKVDPPVAELTEEDSGAPVLQKRSSPKSKDGGSAFKLELEFTLNRCFYADVKLPTKIKKKNHEYKLTAQRGSYMSLNRKSWTSPEFTVTEITPALKNMLAEQAKIKTAQEKEAASVSGSEQSSSSDTVEQVKPQRMERIKSTMMRPFRKETSVTTESDQTSRSRRQRWAEWRNKKQNTAVDETQ
jgi:hypothetical protein